MLGVEILGATSTVLYGLNIILTPVHEPLIDDPANPGLTKVSSETAPHTPCGLAPVTPLLLPQICAHAAEGHVEGFKVIALTACASAQWRLPMPGSLITSHTVPAWYP